MIGLFLAATLAAPAPTASPTPHSVRATASKTDVTVGEPFLVELKAEAPPGTAWTFPAEAGDEQVELRAAAPDLQNAPPVPGTRHYQAIAFALGELEVPPVTVEYRLADGSSGTMASEPIPLRIGSLLPRDPNDRKLADIRAPAALDIGRPFWLALALTLMMLGALALWLRNRRRKRSAPAEAHSSPISPEAEALAALERLQASSSLALGEYRAFYIALAEIAKRYLDRRLEAPVLEMTSSEAVAFLRDHPHGRIVAGVVRELASVADQVKFARGQGRTEEAERHLTAVRQLVIALEAALQPRSALMDAAAAGTRFPQRSLSSLAEAGFTPAEAHDEGRAERGRQS